MTNAGQNTEDAIFNGIAVMTLSEYGNSPRYESVLSGLAKMRSCEVGEVHQAINAHSVRLNDFVAPLKAHNEAFGLLSAEVRASMEVAITDLQGPYKAKFIAYCTKELALSEDGANQLLEKMVARST